MKKIPLRVIFVAMTALVLLVATVLMARRLIINHSYVNAYQNGDYQVEAEESLLTLNFPESYVPYYNLGNAAYRFADYNSAISYYTKALEMHPPKGKDCKIRINLALALCGTIDFNHLDTQDKIDSALFILYKARDVLTEKGCASQEGHDGHDADAQQLKEDIDRMIEKLKNPDQSDSGSQQDNSGSSSDSDSSGGGYGPSDREKKIQGELEGKKKDAMEDRKDQQGTLEKYSDFIGGDQDGSGSGSLEGGEEDGGNGGNGINTSPW